VGPLLSFRASEPLAERGMFDPEPACALPDNDYRRLNVRVEARERRHVPPAKLSHSDAGLGTQLSVVVRFDRHFILVREI